MKVLIYDFETGGLDYLKFSPLSIGACVIDVENGEIIDTFEAFIKLPEYVTEPEAMAVNKINLEDCKSKGLEPDEIATKLMDMFTKHSCSMSGGHNLPFDERFMAHWIFKVTLPELDKIFGYRKLDSCTLIRLLAGTERSPPGASLKQAVKFFKIDMSDFKGGFHSALFDCVACGKLLTAFRKKLNDALK